MTQNYYNPMTSFYRNQMNNIANGYNFTPQYQNMQSMLSQSPMNQFPCRSVSNIKEVEALILDNPTMPHIFTNFPNNEIYVKYIDNTTGNAKIVQFAPKPQEMEQPQQNQPLNDEKTNNRFNIIEENIKVLNDEIVRIKEGLQNDEYIKHDEHGKYNGHNENGSNIKNSTKSNGRNAKDVQ